MRTALDVLADRVNHWVFVSTSNVYADESTPYADESATLRAPLPDATDWAPELYGEGKRSCEEHLLGTAGSEALLIARAGLIAGPGDASGRTGYWPLRFAYPATEDGSVLIPDEPSLLTQQLDVRDLASWLVDCAEDARTGVADAVGEILPLRDYLASAREVAHHTGPLVGRRARSPKHCAMCSPGK
ncbi:hypothetical protein [Demetria terragena]|uniref:hypothetical protein n=1 Tax=Demetria terragena TaxID=63959 RepID=UPI00039B1AB6|nr:hypothetical protein [Demetria terragena]